jgi:hypothetical protein
VIHSKAGTIVHWIDLGGLWAAAVALAQTMPPNGLWDVVTISGVAGVLLYMVFRVLEWSKDEIRSARTESAAEVERIRDEAKHEKEAMRIEWREERRHMDARIDAVEAEAKAARTAQHETMQTATDRMQEFVERSLLCQASTERMLGHISQMADRLAVGQTAVTTVLREIIEQRPCLFENRHELLKVLNVREQSLSDGLEPNALPEVRDDDGGPEVAR